MAWNMLMGDDLNIDSSQEGDSDISQSDIADFQGQGQAERKGDKPEDILKITLRRCTLNATKNIVAAKSSKAFKVEIEVNVGDFVYGKTDKHPKIPAGPVIASIVDEIGEYVVSKLRDAGGFQEDDSTSFEEVNAALNDSVESGGLSQVSVVIFALVCMVSCSSPFLTSQN